jgi:Flp pilus assembly protein TadG
MRSMRDVLGVRSGSSGGIAQQRRKRRGQAAVEFALVLSVAMIVLFVAVQFALIGQIALALGQMNYQAARYAAIHPGCGATACAASPDPDANATPIQPYAFSIASPTIKYANGTSACPCGSVKTFTVTQSSGTPGVNDRAFGTSVVVSVTYNVTSQLFLPANFLGLSFPTTLNSTETAMSE